MLGKVRQMIGTKNYPKTPEELNEEHGQLYRRYSALQRAREEAGELRQEWQRHENRIGELKHLIAYATPDSDFREIAAAEAELRLLERWNEDLREKLIRANDNTRLLERDFDALWNRYQRSLAIQAEYGPGGYFKEQGLKVVAGDELRRLIGA